MSAAKNDSLSVLFEDDFLIAVNKPAGLASQPTPNRDFSDVLTVLKKQLKRDEIFLHHRLDRDTSGIILLSKNKKANAPLTEMFRDHLFERTYWALTKMEAELPSEWEIENNLIARRKDSRSVKMFRTEKGGDFAKTLFRRLAQKADLALVEAKPLTGRTHQIRVHSLHSKASILGDSMYGKKDSRARRLMLHAKSLKFKHPITGAEIFIEAPLPSDFQNLIHEFGLVPAAE
jgi:RluA family pseudouridine synthase